MKKILVLFLIIILITSSCCTKEKNQTSDYQYMYDGIVHEWNKHSWGHKRDSLLGFGEYLYNSQLILFPKETPSTLQEYYFHWTPLMDYDGYAIYFTCRLSTDNFCSFSKELKNFKLQNGENEIFLLYDDSHFEFPTHILQWTEVGEKREVLEYIMLDEKNCTAIFVYTMGELEYIEDHSEYHVTPSQMHFLEENFSIYDNFENSTYDISFLEYLA